MAFGIPQYGNNSEAVFYKNWKLKSPDTAKGESVFTIELRLLPPVHSLAEKGIWAKYHGQHFGYSGNGKEPGKIRQRPFACIQQTDFRTKMVTTACDACSVIDEKRAEREVREAEYKSKGKSESEIRELLEPLTDWLKKHNCDRKWHINAMNRAGEFGVLQISHTLKKALDVKVDEVRNKRKIEPMAPDQGVWFRFARMGKFPVQDSVEYVMAEKDDGSFRIEHAPLTEAQLEAAEKVCPDLQTGVVKFITAAQIAQIVSSSGDPDEIDRIWQLGIKTAEKSPARPVASVAKPVVVAKSAEQIELEKLKAELAALKNAAVTVTPSESQTVTTANTVTPAVEEDDLSDEEFYAKYNPK
jgi:hypothetical protein